MFRLINRLFYWGVSGFVTDCPCIVWCRGLFTCLLYVVPLFGNLSWKYSCFISLTKFRTIFSLFFIMFTYTYILMSHNIFVFVIFHVSLWFIFCKVLFYSPFTSINCCKKHSIATITKLRSLELLIKTPLLHILYYINGFTHNFWTRTGGWEFDRSHSAGTSSPFHWQQVEEQAPIYIYIYVHSLYEFCYRSYIQRECHSVLAKLHPITFYRGVRGSWSECHFVFSLVYQLCPALCSKSNTRMLVTFGICLKNILILGIWCSTIPHIPGCFCSWTFFENIGFNTVLTDPFMLHLATQLGYSAGEFQALQLIVLAAFAVVD